ncbi:hypothetical protein CEXT_622361 [Caerostris extrusa]|uniref:Uncharacterized protein n=1 Tax=Caerostris extrusa TaxID=172846 RepID=A0AAV4SDQ2_CAEEX|nr:hypothetical protein CEXT_622361 [Caerostris extrusa]
MFTNKEAAFPLGVFKYIRIVEYILCPTRFPVYKLIDRRASEIKRLNGNNTNVRKWLLDANLNLSLSLSLSLCGLMATSGLWYQKLCVQILKPVDLGSQIQIGKIWVYF